MLYSSQIKKLKEIICSLGPQLPYHNGSHMLEVAETCRKYGKMEGLGKKDLDILETSGLLHDIVYFTARTDNEARSADMARLILPSMGYKPKDVDDVANLIIVTGLSKTPKTLMEKIIRDSDIDNLGRDDFLEKTELLRREAQVKKRDDFYIGSYNFLKNISYFTKSARNLRSDGVKKNMEQLKDIITQYMHRC